MYKATSFIFDGKSSEDFGVRICYFDSSSTVNSTLWDNEIIEDRLTTRQDPILYGINTNQSMTYTLTFGSDNYLTHLDAEKIAEWLTSHNAYKWLEFVQNDLQGLRYKAIIQGLETIHINGEPVAFTCKVVTDCQYAYEYPKEFSYDLSSGNVTLNNSSTLYGYYYPKMEIIVDENCDTISICNKSDSSRLFRFAGLPAMNKKLTISVDNRNQIVTCDSNDLNLYKYFHDDDGIPRFFRLLQGSNELELTGKGEIKFICEFPRKVGL